MSELINLFFCGDNLFTGSVVAIVTFLFTLNINKNKAITDTFKKEGITVQERLLDFWSNVFILGFEESLDNFKVKAKLDKKLSELDVFNYIKSESIRYSSKNTVKMMATYQQYIYKNSSLEKNAITKDKDTMELIVLALRVVKSMKYDFTGEKISVMDLIKIHIKNLNWRKYLLIYFYLVFYYIYDKIPLLLFLTLIVKLFEIMY